MRLVVIAFGFDRQRTAVGVVATVGNHLGAGTRRRAGITVRPRAVHLRHNLEDRPVVLNHHRGTGLDPLATPPAEAPPARPLLDVDDDGGDPGAAAALEAVIDAVLGALLTDA